MEWSFENLHGRCSGLNWGDPAWLQRTDPYLVWFDLTDFSGAQIPGVQRNRIPAMLEYPEGSALRFMSRAFTREDLPKLCQDLLAGRVTRFELGLPLLNPDAMPQAQPNAPAQTKLPVSAKPSPSGRPVVGFIDFGCAFAHRQFRVWEQDQPTLRTRVAALWDQTHIAQAAADGPLPLCWSFAADFPYGAEARRGQSEAEASLDLDGFIQQFAVSGQVDEARCYQFAAYEGVRQAATHGTHMMDIATGYPSPLAGIPGMPPEQGPHEADIIFVQLPRRLNGRQVGGMLRANVYDAIRYIVSRAGTEADIVINLSYGGYAGPHDGSSVLECAIDWYLRKERARRRHGARLDLVIPSGNARDKSLHAFAKIPKDGMARFHLNLLPEDPTDSFVEVWLPPGGERAEVRLVSPGGETGAWVSPGQAGVFMRAQNLLASVVYADRVCQSGRGAMVLIAFSPTQIGEGRNTCPYGRWVIEVRNRSEDPAEVHAWCERDDAALGTAGGPRQAYFSNGLPEDGQVSETHSLNSLAHGLETLVVGGSIPGSRQPPSYSSIGPGRGLTAGRNAQRDNDSLPGPQQLAPSDESVVVPGLAAAAVLGAAKVRFNGSSVATAVVTRERLEEVLSPMSKQAVTAGIPQQAPS